jgi:ATP-dependent exoDNAse (exonuclease V) alpha subunit
VAAYRCSVQVVSRSSGRSAVAAAAYRAGVELHDHRQGLVHDYTRKQDIAHCEILQPAGSPAFFADREKLWNAVEAGEKRKDAQLAREVEVMLPRELSQAENLALLRGYVAEQFVARGMVADLSLHTGHKASDGKAQPHAHIMLTMREIGPDGFGKKVREWNDKDQLAAWREAWADHANRSLERAGRDERVDHRTLAAQREDALQRGDTDKVEELTREPVGKVPVAAWQMEQRGVKTDAGDRQRAAKGRNEQYREWGRQLAEVRAQIAERLREVGRVAKEQILAAKDRLAKALGRDRAPTPDREKGEDRKRGHDPGTNAAAERLRERMAERGRSVREEEKERTRDRARDRDRDRGGPER